MTTNEPTNEPTTAVTGERADLLATLAKHRHFLRFTTRDLDDKQAALQTTASELCLGGLIKHVTGAERTWGDFIRDGRHPISDFTKLTEEDWARWTDGFRMLPGETLSGVLADYAEVARRTDELIATVPDLDVLLALPNAPWFEETHWSVRRTVLHLIAETAQHAGHADIIRESLDGAKSMG